MSVSTPTEINNFLIQFKFFAQDLSAFTFIETEKNMKSLAKLGMNTYQAATVIKQLTYKNYSKGPEVDRKYKQHDIWEFGYTLDGVELYIKLSSTRSI